jgi:hypothetical protein
MIKRFSLAGLVFLLLALCLAACGGAPEAVTEEGDETGYSIEFSALNTEKVHEFSLAEGDRLRVEVTHKGGRIRLTIRREEGDEIYTGNGLISRSFTVGIPESGRYTVTVAGEKADGRVKIEKTE